MTLRPLCALGQCLVVSGLLFSSWAHAASTTILPNPGAEPDLAEPGGILDHYFGLENLSRVDDDLDRYWENDGRIKVKVLGKWAGFSQTFGYIDEQGAFTSLLSVRRWGRPAAHFNSEDSGSLFRFGLDPSGAPLWSSNPSDNPDFLDHMVTWQITSSRNKHLIGSYVIAWEDLSGGGDLDFNDLVVLVKGDVSPIPVPAALWLFASGLIGLSVAARRR